MSISRRLCIWGSKKYLFAPLSSLQVRALMHVANFNEEGRPRSGLIEGRDSADCFIRSASPIRGRIYECLYVPRQEAADSTGGFVISYTRRSSQACMPERLWTVYRGGAADTMVSSAWDAAQKDLSALAPPQGLSQSLFEAYVGGIFRQMPLMAEIDRLASSGLNDSQAHEFLKSRLQDDAENPVEQTWRVLKAWLVHFFPQTYRLETGQEVLIKGQELQR